MTHKCRFCRGKLGPDDILEHEACRDFRFRREITRRCEMCGKMLVGELLLTCRACRNDPDAQYVGYPGGG